LYQRFLHELWGEVKTCLLIGGVKLYVGGVFLVLQGVAGVAGCNSATGATEGNFVRHWREVEGKEQLQRRNYFGEGDTAHFISFRM